MRCIIQRVNRASIVINGKSGGQIGKGLLVLCAFSDGDDEKTVDYCVEKIANLRIFEDENGKLNLSVLDVKGNVMVVFKQNLHIRSELASRKVFKNIRKLFDGKVVQGLADFGTRGFIERRSPAFSGVGVKREV